MIKGGFLIHGRILPINKCIGPINKCIGFLTGLSSINAIKFFLCDLFFIALMELSCKGYMSKLVVNLHWVLSTCLFVTISSKVV